MEQFIPIKNFETYAINKKGEILDLRNKKIMKQYPNINAGNYLQVGLNNENGFLSQRVHRLVAETFIKNDNPLLEVDHIDRDRHNNNFDNLRWVSKTDQMENKNTYGKSGKKYIFLEDLKSKKNPNPSWVLRIKNSKLNFSKRFQYSNYTLDDIVIFRNKLLIENNIQIID
tara:strand:- start:82 stop:594 length:513 start_codon:yes stop_codon:yes gene_type:complete